MFSLLYCPMVGWSGAKVLPRSYKNYALGWPLEKVKEVAVLSGNDEKDCMVGELGCTYDVKPQGSSSVGEEMSLEVYHGVVVNIYISFSDKYLENTHTTTEDFIKRVKDKYGSPDRVKKEERSSLLQWWDSETVYEVLWWENPTTVPYPIEIKIADKKFRVGLGEKFGREMGRGERKKGEKKRERIRQIPVP